MPLKPTVRGWLYQPFASGLREGVAVTAGPVSSYWKPKLLLELVLPATSRQTPLTDAFAESGPE